LGITKAHNEVAEEAEEDEEDEEALDNEE